MKTIFLLFIAILAGSLPSKSFAQCCAAGNPVSSNCSLLENGKNTLGVSYSHIYSLSDTYFNGTNKLDKKYIETDFNFSFISLSYGLSNNLRLLADVGYFLNKTQNFVNSDFKGYDRERLANGLGDLNLGLSYNTFQSDDKEFKISNSARATLPIGVFNQVYDGVELPIDLQPSSGNYKLNFGVSFTKQFAQTGFSLYSINSVELSQFIQTANSNFKYGNLYNLSLVGSYDLMQNLGVRLQLRGEIREKALTGLKNQTNELINASGGVITFLSPQINFTMMKDWNCSAQFNYPIYKNVNSEQLTNHYSVQVGVSKSFNFGILENSILKENSEPESKLISTKFKVFGNCEMCQARIEKVVNKFKNVEESEWSPETKMLTIFYKETMPDITEIQKAIAAVGHDTETFKAVDAVYAKLPKCCLYRGK